MSHRSEPKPPPQRKPRKSANTEKTNCQTVENLVSPNRPNSAHHAYFECATAWYRRSVPNRSTTNVQPRSGWVGGRETRNTHLVPPGVCGNWSLLAVWDPRFFPGATGRSSQCGTRGFPGLTANPHPHKLFSTQCERKLPHISLVPKCQHKQIGTRSSPTQNNESRETQINS